MIGAGGATLLATLERAGCPVGALVRGSWTSASGYDAAMTLLDAGTLGTALFVANDQMALGALRALAEHGARVPEDVSVVGFDDVDDAANYRPPLTTVRQHFDRLGTQAVVALLDEVEEGLEVGTDAPTVSERTVMPASLIVRGSTGPAPA
ncbi:substrate-binding domain-containing protein [Microbacterium hominis]|uniref:substrate-binding domain-containing protein n=1 Tax=Microbacterium hominis TaxID=162426 RepID=UPI000ABFA08E|nr:substrate-binding domain-containing protein [Microbacterium hominis]